MLGYKDSYDPEDTETFKFFGSPKVQPHITPVACFFADVANVFLNSRLIHVVLSTFWTDRKEDELYLWAPPVLSLAWFTVWSMAQVPVVMTALTLLLITGAVGSVFIFLHDVLIWRIIQGPQLQVWPPTLPPNLNPRHRWVYINGVATGKTITRQNLQCLSDTFHNPVLAVNNRTYGFMGDILECIIQRAFGYRTGESSILRDIISTYLRDHANVDRVIFIAHSQGGIIASHVLADLFCSLSPDDLARLEVYTFGNAALNFPNPHRDRTRTRRIIPVIEHYCNERDMVTSWGALASTSSSSSTILSTPKVPPPVFEGKVFVFESQTGHMLNQHYLRHMFTGPSRSWRDEDFQLRAVRRDAGPREKFFVGANKANVEKGEESVRSVSRLWRYMDVVANKDGVDADADADGDGDEVMNE